VLDRQALERTMPERELNHGMLRACLWLSLRIHRTLTLATTCCIQGGIIPLHVGHVKVASRFEGQAGTLAWIMAPESTWYCIRCGVRLEPGHRFCPSCGAARWSPEPEQAEPPLEAVPVRPPPVPGTPVFGVRPAPAPQRAAAPGGRVGLGLLPWFYALGAFLFLLEATQGLASLASPAGRAQLAAELTRQGSPASMQQGILTAYWTIQIGGSLVAAALHGAAFYGLRRFRRWGWIAAVVVAALWSLVLVGLPVLIRLMNRNVRQSFGVD
jgi:zinc ribbon protein